jgi:response regulator RpfG family c-di-GMP phosphodiesterase
LQILLVDDDSGFRALLRTTFEAVDVEVDEADNAASAAACIERRPPDVVVLDVRMPGLDGISFCRKLKGDPRTRGLAVVLLTGSDPSGLESAGADAVMRKPFSPLELLAAVERLAGGLYPIPFRATKKLGTDEQLALYARDLRHLLEIERGQRALLERAYHDTVAALASALETKDTGTRAHSQRVQRYAVELTRELDTGLAGDPSAEFGFLLHDVGKIGIPDKVLQKPGPLTEVEWSLMRTHTVLGEQMLGGIDFLQGEAVRVVRSHHERWDGGGYPDGLDAADIPLGARVFAVADALDAITSDRPYRRAAPWQEARAEIAAQAGRQFDPDVADAFRAVEPILHEIHREFAAA